MERYFIKLDGAFQTRLLATASPMFFFTERNVYENKA